MIIGDDSKNSLGAQWEPRQECMWPAVNGSRSGKEEEVAGKASGENTFPARGGGLFIYHLFTYWAHTNTDAMKLEERAKWKKWEREGNPFPGRGESWKRWDPEEQGRHQQQTRSKRLLFYFISNLLICHYTNNTWMRPQKHHTLQLKLMHSTKLLLTVWFYSSRPSLYIVIIHK